jgi:hypothetical protein
MPPSNPDRTARHHLLRGTTCARGRGRSPARVSGGKAHRGVSEAILARCRCRNWRQRRFRCMSAPELVHAGARRGLLSRRPRTSSWHHRRWRGPADPARETEGCGDPGLPPEIPVMHTIHDPRKTIVNPHNRVGITEYIIHYITSTNSLTWPLG